MLRPDRAGHGRQDGRRKPLGRNAFECVGIGKHGPQRLEAGRLWIDEGSGNLLAQRDPQSRDHALARIDRHIARGRKRFALFGRLPTPFSVKTRRFGLHDRRDGRQEIDGPFDVALKRRRQGNRQTIDLGREHDAADLDGKVSAAVNDRQDTDPRTNSQKLAKHRRLERLNGLADYPIWTDNSNVGFVRKLRKTNVAFQGSRTTRCGRGSRPTGPIPRLPSHWDKRAPGPSHSWFAR